MEKKQSFAYLYNFCAGSYFDYKLSLATFSTSATSIGYQILAECQFSYETLFVTLEWNREELHYVFLKDKVKTAGTSNKSQNTYAYKLGT